MGSINISLKEVAYKRLNSLKLPNESFSDEIIRLTNSSSASVILRFAGVWKNMSGKELNQMTERIATIRKTNTMTLKLPE